MVSGEKRNCEDGGALEKINAILLDIEGTTTSISFVKDTLFPYVRENLKTHIENHWNDEEFKADLKALKAQAKKDAEDKVDNFCPIEEGDNEKESLIKNVFWQMDADRKNIALKQLQGHIWREGYESGKLKGHDVAQMMKKWCEQDRKLYIFSSGSVESQKLLFKHSESGDIQGLISGYFSLETGPKTEASSYSSLSEAIGHDCSQILFLTDVIKEAVAADKAGMQVMVVVREGNMPLTEDEKKAFPTISSFEDVVLESSNKKKKICEEEAVQPEPGKTENVSTETNEPPKTENGDSEKMEVETTETQSETISEKKTEEKSEANAATESPEADAENVEIDVDDSTVAKEPEEKVVSSSSENEGKEAVTSNGLTDPTVEEPAEKETKEEEKVDSTEEAAVAVSESESKPETEKEVKEISEEVEDKTSNEKSVNGHEVSEEKEVKAETNGKLEEEPETETIAVKKVTPEEQADSTVEVTA